MTKIVQAVHAQIVHWHGKTLSDIAHELDSLISQYGANSQLVVTLNEATAESQLNVYKIRQESDSEYAERLQEENNIRIFHQQHQLQVQALVEAADLKEFERLTAKFNPASTP